MEVGKHGLVGVVECVNETDPVKTEGALYYDGRSVKPGDRFAIVPPHDFTPILAGGKAIQIGG